MPKLYGGRCITLKHEQLEKLEAVPDGLQLPVAFSCTALTIANHVEDFSVLKPLFVAYARVLKYRSIRMALRVFSSASNSLNNAAMSLRMAKG